MPNDEWTVPLLETGDVYLADGALRSGKKPIKRKTFSDQSTDTISDIFGIGVPYTVDAGLITQFIEFHPELAVREPYRWSVPKSQIGIEVEVENVLKIDPNIGLCFWAIKQDGSLRNNGREFVTPGVISVPHAEAALMHLFGGLNSNIDFSSRTSIHVHLDVRQLTLEQLLSLLLAYTTVENLLFKFVGNVRRNNIFCVPILETGLFDNLGKDPKRFLWSIDNYWSKYTALNLLPILNQGSIEFRHMPGTSDVPKILRWIDMMTRLKVFSYKYSLDYIVNAISELNSNSRYRQFVELIFDDLTTYLDMTQLLPDMEKAVYIVKNSAISNKFHDMLLKTPKEDSHLGKRLNSWMKKLAPEQQEALLSLSKIIGHDAETLFRDLITRPSTYLRAYPDQAALIQKIIKSSLIKKSAKAVFNPTELIEVEQVPETFTMSTSPTPPTEGNSTF